MKSVHKSNEWGKTGQNGKEKAPLDMRSYHH